MEIDGSPEESGESPNAEPTGQQWVHFHLNNIRFVVMANTGLVDMQLSSGTGAMSFAGTPPEGTHSIRMEGLSWPIAGAPEELRMQFHNNFVLTPGNDDSEGPGYLAHYTRFSRAKEILESGELRLSRFTRANDDRERRPWLFDFYCNAEGLLGEGKAVEYSYKLSQVIKGSWAFASFSADEAGFNTRDLVARSDNPIWQNPSMWAAYGGRHSNSDSSEETLGAVLLFDREKLLAAARAKYPEKGFIVGPIHYVKGGLLGGGPRYPYQIFVMSEWTDELCFEQAKAHFNENYRELFFTKFDGWSHEREYRILANALGDELVGIPIEEALTHVLVGEGSAKSLPELVEVGAHLRGTEFFEVKWRNGLPVCLEWQNEDAGTVEVVKQGSAEERSVP